MDVQRIAAFSHGEEGGNPAGVVLLDAPAGEAEMARVAAEVGFSETAFAVSQGREGHAWRVRYFAPESEVPFCGHATIALGAALGRRHGPGRYDLQLNNASITVDANTDADGIRATLTSPPTNSRPLKPAERADLLSLFGLKSRDLDQRLDPALIHGGADHALLPLKDRSTLAAMHYDIDRGRTIMRQHNMVTVMLVHIDTDQAFSVRNAFASGGVLEDPATGAAAAAFAGYLRDQGWPHDGQLTIRQGEDMGCPSIIDVELDDRPGAPVRVSGRARWIDKAA
ncbi:MAG: PhzF family phenazine biosynthesis protein [Pseudomonadota bacterium]